MEALFASCSEEFQSIRSSQVQVTSTAEGLKAELLAHGQKLQHLDNSINQQLRILGRRISARETRPSGVQPASAGGDPSPVGAPPASAGAAAAGLGSSAWTPDDWARWRNGAWRSSQSTPAPAGAQSAWADGSWQASQARGWPAPADGAPG
eukprot:15437100-Alexandrium_andersonii.AAC.1